MFSKVLKNLLYGKIDNKCILEKCEKSAKTDNVKILKTNKQLVISRLTGLSAACQNQKSILAVLTGCHLFLKRIVELKFKQQMYPRCF